MTRLLAYLKAFAAREPVLVRAAVGFVLGVAVTRFGLDPALEATLLVAITGAVSVWARSKVSPAP